MSIDLEQMVTELETMTSRMLATTCWENTREFGELSASRHALAAQLMDRQDLDASAAERIRAVIQTGSGLLARVMAMRDFVLAEIAQAETQRRFNHELGSTVTVLPETHQLDLNA